MRKLFVICLIICLSTLCSALLSESDRGQSLVKSSSNIFSSSSTDPSNVGINTECVSLYTGQHQESFPLVGLAGKGGVGVSLALDYTGNVANIARAENDIAQASYFGLGFNLGKYSIIVDHRSTTDIQDDRYTLIGGNQSIELIAHPDTTNRYVLSDGTPWVVVRHVDTINQLGSVIGWTVKHEDGMVYRYGDFYSDFDSLNATQNILRYGSFVGNGVLNDDAVFPHRWDLKLFHDPDSLNWVEFTYKRDSAYLFVMDSNGDSTSSANAYTRYSYLSSILASDSTKAEFYFSGRTDTGGFYGFNNFEFYSNKKVDSVCAYSMDGTCLSRTRFIYNYMTHNDIRKLVLKEIISKSGDGSISLPKTEFTYFTADTCIAYGSISKIKSSTGSIKELQYSTIASDSNLSQLDYSFWNYQDVLNGDSLLSPYNFSLTPEDHIYTSENIFLVATEPLLRYASNMAGNFISGYWDGYWHIDTIYTRIDRKDLAGLSNDGWMAFFDRNTQEMRVRRWMDGYWKYDPVGGIDTIPGTYNIYVYPGDNCFVAATGTYGERCDDGAYTRHLKKVFYYRWDGNQWNCTEIYDAGASGWDEFVVIHAGDFFYLAKSQYIGSGSCNPSNASIYAGYYDFELDNVEYEQIVYAENWSFTNTPNCAFGPGYYGYLGFNHVYYGQFDGSDWITGNQGYYDAIPYDGLFDSSSHSRSLAPLANGMIWGYDHNGENLGSFIQPLFATANGLSPLKPYRFPYDEIVTHQMWGSNHGVAAQYTNGRMSLWEWQGDTLVWNHDIYSDSLPVGTPMDFSLSYYRLYGAQYFRNFNGYANWDNTYTTVASATKSSPYGYMLFNLYRGYGDSANIAMFGRHNSKYHWNSYAPHYLSINLNQCAEILDSASIHPFYFAENSSFFYASKYSVEDSVYTCHDLRFGGQAFKIIDTLFQNKPPMAVIDKVFLYEHSADTIPVVQDYAYLGGVLDKSGLTPRFTKATVSLPYFDGDSPDGYAVTYFYNDLSDTIITDGHYATTVSIPDLNEFSIVGSDTTYQFGIENGGYWLDGMPFLTYSYSADSGTSEEIAYTRNYYQVYKFRDSSIISGVYHKLLDSTVSYMDGKRSKTSYTYDLFNLQPIEVRREHKKDTSDYVTWMQFGCLETEDGTLTSIAQNMRSDNVLALPVIDSAYYIDKVANDTTTLSKSKSKYCKKGNWIAYETTSYRDFDDPTSAFTSIVDTSTVDERGNVYAIVDIQGDTSWVKYDDDKLRVIGSGANCSYGDFLIQDFEQEDGWDGWNYRLGDLYTLNSSSFTGELCYKASYGEGTGWMTAYKRIESDSLSDSLYYFGAWTRTTHRVDYYVYGSYVGGGYKDTVFTFYANTPGQLTDWTKNEVILNMSEIFSGQSVDYIYVGFKAFGPGTSGTNDIYIDNVRFHPLDARVLTKVYDESTGLVTSNLDLDNTPVNYEYDSFFRVSETKDYKNDVLSKTNYYTHHGLCNISVRALADGSDVFDTVEYVYQGTSQSLQWVSKFNFRADPDDTIKTEILNTRSQYSWSQLFDQDDDNLDEVYYSSATIAVDDGDTVLLIASSECSEERNSCYMQLNYADTLGISNDETSPPAVETFTYQSRGTGCDTLRSISYYSNLGRLLQTRSTNFIIEPNIATGSVDTTEATLVTGCAEYDSRGRVIKAYRPYYDITNAISEANFTPADSILIEASAYYNGTYEANCSGRPYSEIDYFSDVKGRKKESAMPGASGTWGLSQHTTSYEYSSNDDCFITRVSDPDNVTMVSMADKWGQYSMDTSYYDNGSSYIATKSYQNIKGQVDSVQIFSTDTVMTRKYEYNDLGQITREYRVDYGWIDMFYDVSGNLRFMQNDKRSAENKFVYFKYDEFNRKIEEGLCPTTIASQNVFVQDSADSREFPSSTLAGVKSVKYRWKYDYNFNADSSVNYDALVRIENEDSSYYKEFYYSPFEYKDSVWVKLPIDSSDHKSIVHVTDNLSGKILELRVYPYEDTTGAREYEYLYDLSGRFEALREGDFGSSLDYTRDYVQYSYNASGGRNQMLMGRYDSLGIDTFTCQTVAYSYNPQGMMQYINDPASISTMTGNGDHFGMKLYYDDGPAGANQYYNGRVARLESAHSADTGVVSNTYNYTYNELNWLTDADYNGDGSATSSSDRAYDYNYLGNRTTLTKNQTAKTYVYKGDTSSVKSDTSSILCSDDDNWGSQYYRTYDTLGNLTSIPSNFIPHMQYDYRNLLDSVTINPMYMGLDNHSLNFWYDEMSRRIRKKYRYSYLGDCCDTCSDTVGGGGIELMTMGPMGPGGDQCQFWQSTERFYLYDGSTLLMIFGGQDQEEYVYVNSPIDGQVAVYHFNVDSTRYYFLKDQIGNTRAMLDDAGDVVYHSDYHPFGEMSQSWSSYDEPMKFTGKERDKYGNFDFYYFGARYYDPKIGNFSSIDKAAQSTNGFAYCGNNPISFTDPDGNWFGIDDLIISGTAFVFGYMQYGMENGSWGDKALAHGAASAASAWLGYNLGGSFAKDIMKYSKGSSGYAIGAAAAGGAVGGSSGSFLHQSVDKMYGNGTRGYDWGSIGMGALSGGAGGFAGGITGQHVFSDQVMPAIFGGGVGSAVSGGNILEGVALGGAEAFYTMAWYHEYGSRKTKNTWGELPHELTINRPNEFCHSFVAKFLKEGDNYLVWKANIWIEKSTQAGLGSENKVTPGHLYEVLAHSGFELGRTKYGQTMVLSKLGRGVDKPIKVTTGVYLNNYFRAEHPITKQRMGHAWFKELSFSNSRHIF